MTIDILEDGQKIFNSTDDEFLSWIRKAFDLRSRIFGSDLFCFSPTGYPHKIPSHTPENPHNFPSLSVTGTGCALDCEHCSGKLLKGMKATTTPESLFEECKNVEQRGGDGVLISGGSDPHGHVPLKPFLDTISRIKNELDLKVVVHTGLISEDVAKGLAQAEIDAAMLDVIANSKIAREVYHLQDGPKKIEQSMDILNQASIPITPHVLIGLNYGEIGGELEALSMISRKNPSAVVFIVLNPIKNTPMENVAPPSPKSVGRLLTIARHGFPETPLLLGCARPLGQHKIESDKIAIRSGMNGIAYISQEGVEFSKKMGLHPIFQDVCCSLIPVMIG